MAATMSEIEMVVMSIVAETLRVVRECPGAEIQGSPDSADDGYDSSIVEAWCNDQEVSTPSDEVRRIYISTPRAVSIAEVLVEDALSKVVSNLSSEGIMPSDSVSVSQCSSVDSQELMTQQVKRFISELLLGIQSKIASGNLEIERGISPEDQDLMQDIITDMRRHVVSSSPISCPSPEGIAMIHRDTIKDIIRSTLGHILQKDFTTDLADHAFIEDLLKQLPENSQVRVTDKWEEVNSHPDPEEMSKVALSIFSKLQLLYGDCRNMESEISVMSNTFLQDFSDFLFLEIIKAEPKKEGSESLTQEVEPEETARISSIPPNTKKKGIKTFLRRTWRAIKRTFTCCCRPSVAPEL
ncbi:uncharacterized protein LOC127450039 [Myxocyprinus asiaticus]|uniref:uncharacterized protein LOC127450039 n=1 Tax=Myxocyprinus asiaticus TaxID=70543 RepID=UPI002221C022|nr:uncharacterized protein LOC127450039 [Myxocyprinus asiaticus]XP_051569710.1 uncharacterized protein LOC127450039 [Myxocyprinus asiaticus]